MGRVMRWYICVSFDADEATASPQIQLLSPKSRNSSARMVGAVPWSTHSIFLSSAPYDHRRSRTAKPLWSLMEFVSTAKYVHQYHSPSLSTKGFLSFWVR